MLRVHLRVGNIDFSKKLRDLKVRPFVVLQLLYFLIDRGHPVFKGKGAAIELKERMRVSVTREYPETEDEKPLEERQGHVPESILRVLREIENEKRKSLEDGTSTEPPAKRIRLISVLDDKNATPGNAPTTAEECLNHVQPVYVTLDRSAQSLSDPAQ